jgi:hypothetical protein
VDWSKPQLAMPREALTALMSMRDEDVTARLSVPTPPVVLTD